MQIIFGIGILAIALWLAMWVVVAALISWLVFQIILRVREPGGSLTRRRQSDIAGEWTIIAGILSVFAAITMLLANPDIPRLTPLYAACAAALAVIAYIKESTRSPLTIAALVLTFALGALVAVISGLWLLSHSTEEGNASPAAAHTIVVAIDVGTPKMTAYPPSLQLSN